MTPQPLSLPLPSRLVLPCLRVLVGQDCLRLPPTASARSSRSFFGITFAACCARVLCATGLAFRVICADGAGPGAASRARGTEYAAAGSLTPAPPHLRLVCSTPGVERGRHEGVGRGGSDCSKVAPPPTEANATALHCSGELATQFVLALWRLALYSLELRADEQ